jgi:hypothetical protein
MKKKILLICFLILIIPLSIFLWQINTYKSISSYLSYDTNKIKNIHIVDGSSGKYIDVSNVDEINRFMNQLYKIEVKKKLTANEYYGWKYSFTITDTNDKTTKIVLAAHISVDKTYYIQSSKTANQFDTLIKMCDTAFEKLNQDSPKAP